MDINRSPNPTARSNSAYLVTLKATIWAVMVVPILDPMTTPMVWESDMSPADTKPTSMTVVTELD